MKKIITKSGHEVLVDNEDYKYLIAIKWYIKNNGDGNLYAVWQDGF